MRESDYMLGTSRNSILYDRPACRCPADGASATSVRELTDTLPEGGNLNHTLAGKRPAASRGAAKRAGHFA